MTDLEKIELSPHYYRDNFLRLCDTVEAQYEDILTNAERAVLTCFRQLEFKAQCLYVRLVSRTGPWFRESKLEYQELGAIAPILNELIDCKMVLEADGLTLEVVTRLYTRKELQQAFFPDVPPGRFASKATLLCAIEALSLDEQKLLQTLRGCDSQRLIAPLGAELVANLQILFFGNRHQSLTDFVLEDLGVTRYFSYQLDRNHRLFSNRDAFEEYLFCAALSDEHRVLLEAGQRDRLPELAEQALALNIRFASSENRWHRLCNALARDLERQEHWETALQLYQRSKLHPARERRARVLERCGDWAAADTLCTHMLLDPWCEAEQEAAARIQPRVKRKLGGSRQARQRDAFTNVTLSLPAGDKSVEHLAAAQLLDQWQAVHYVENSLMSSLFGLAFWEQIFEAVPGAFHHPYQSAPADMYERTFCARRQNSIATRLDQLRSSNLADILRQAYQRYQFYRCNWMDWRRINVELVEAASRTIPAAHLLAVWERILFDPLENRRGFPDLIALGSRAGDYCMIEVKGPGDALQDNQKRWLRYFQTHQIPAQVAWVEWTT